MATIDEHKQDVSKYTSAVDNELVEALAKTYRLVLTKKDSEYVACGQASELALVRDSFLKKKLGLPLPDEDLDAAIADVCEKMKDSRNKSRLTFYYLLADRFKAKDKLV